MGYEYHVTEGILGDETHSMYGLPAQSPVVAVGQHAVFDYELPTAVAGGRRTGSIVPHVTVCSNSVDGNHIIKMSGGSASVFRGEKLVIFSLSGTIVDKLSTDNDTFVWDSHRLPGGMYLMKFESARNVLRTRFTLVR